MAFEAVLQERNITRAALRLGLSQSAVSGAVARLRMVFKDVLFIRTVEGMNPSPTATDLYPAIKEVLDILRTTIGSSTNFDPTADHSFTIGMSDYASSILLPRLIRFARAKYPNLILHIESLSPGRIVKPLEEGEIDLAVSMLPTSSSNFNSNLIFKYLLDETYVVVMCRSNPLARKRLTLERYVRSPHALVSPDGLKTNWWGVIDAKLTELGMSRTVHATSQSFPLSLLSISGTDLIMSVPRRIANAYANKFNLVTLPSPVKTDTFSVGLIWHRRSNLRPALAWLRQQIIQIAKDIDQTKQQ